MEPRAAAQRKTWALRRNGDLMQLPRKRWLPLVLSTSVALALWGLATTRGYAWQLIWLPAAVTGAAWPRKRKRPLRDCIRPPRPENRGA
jgi:hypothetical protein